MYLCVLIITLCVSSLSVHPLSRIHHHCELKVSSSQAKIYKNFANYFLKPKARYSAKMYM